MNAASNAQDEALPGGTIGGWTLLERIGKGGMGEVWKAERVGAAGVRRRAAVKRILAKYQSDAVLVQRFLAEAKITARLEHPNIVQVLDFGASPELYLVLEYIEGSSLLEWLQRASRHQCELPIEAAVYAIMEAAAGLDYAHRRTDEMGNPLQIVHRDVSPGNLLVSVDGAVKVNDFGVARAADNIVRTEVGLAVGKLVYMAPEQAAGNPVDRRADLFALGVCLWELLALRPLLPRGNPGEAMTALLRCAFPPPSHFSPNVPPALDALVLSCLRLDKTERPANGEVLYRSLRSILMQLRPEYTARDFAWQFREAIPRLSKLPQHEPPSAAAPSVNSDESSLGKQHGGSSSYQPSPTPSPFGAVSSQASTYAAPPQPINPTSNSAPPASQSKLIVVLVLVVVLLAATLGAVIFSLSSSSETSQPSAVNPPTNMLALPPPSVAVLPPASTPTPPIPPTPTPTTPTPLVQPTPAPPPAPSASELVRATITGAATSAAETCANRLLNDIRGTIRLEGTLGNNGYFSTLHVVVNGNSRVADRDHSVCVEQQLRLLSIPNAANTVVAPIDTTY